MTTSVEAKTMMLIHSETQTFLDAVERSAGKKFLFRYEVALLVEIAEQHALHRVLDDILFYAKFLSHASVILKRFGPSSEETAKVSQEFKEKLEQTSTLINVLLKEAPEEVKRLFAERFLSLSQASMDAFVSLLHEMSWLKNYLLDKDRPQK